MPQDTPSIRRLREQIRSLQLLIGLNRLLRSIGLGSERIEELRPQLDALQAQMDDLIQYPERFNRYFAEDGWLAHDSLNFEVMKAAVDQHESVGHEAGSAVLMDHFSPDNLADRLAFVYRAEDLRVRRHLIELALEDYRSGRYHAVIPILLMMIDGAVNDAGGRGLHAETLDLDVWDSLTASDGSMEHIKRIFQRSRRKTRTETIALPYRHGILHGMDLGYASVDRSKPASRRHLKTGQLGRQG